VSWITVRGIRKTCGSPLAAFKLHSRVAMQILWHRKTPALGYLGPVLADGAAAGAGQQT